MNDYKATDIMFLKKQFARQSPEKERAFLGALTPELREVYQLAMPISWVACRDSFAIVEKALPYLDDEGPADFRDFGRDVVHNDFGGLYKILLKVASIDYVAASVEKFWSTFNKKGKALSQRIKGENRIIFTVVEYADMPENYLQLLAGYLEELFLMVGAKHAKAAMDASDRNALKCIVVWEG